VPEGDVARLIIHRSCAGTSALNVAQVSLSGLQNVRAGLGSARWPALTHEVQKAGHQDACFFGASFGARHVCYVQMKDNHCVPASALLLPGNLFSSA
jgi:hypothetical protein